MDVVFIGAGRLATHLAKEMYSKLFNIRQVYSRTMVSASVLANQVGALATNNLDEIVTDAELYVFSVTDSALENVLMQVPQNNGLWVHTSGSMPLSIFDDITDRCGVLYPFQTFTKDRELQFGEIPFFIETRDEQDLLVLRSIVSKLSDKIYNLSSEKRQYLHLTGVFACNFVNHMYAISEDILSKENIPFEVLLPLIDETAAKVHSFAPKDAQTGPAIRYDENIINKHLALLDDPELKTIYSQISESIHKMNK